MNDPGYQRCPQTGKRGYSSPIKAKLMTKRASNRFRLYRCAYCHRWHVTSKV